jgi:hypothetical protein
MRAKIQNSLQLTADLWGPWRAKITKMPHLGCEKKSSYVLLPLECVNHPLPVPCACDGSINARTPDQLPLAGFLQNVQHHPALAENQRPMTSLLEFVQKRHYKYLHVPHVHESSFPPHSRPTLQTTRQHSALLDKPAPNAFVLAAGLLWPVLSPISDVTHSRLPCKCEAQARLAPSCMTPSQTCCATFSRAPSLRCP